MNMVINEFLTIIEDFLIKLSQSASQQELSFI
jgi:hypothetical protein